MHRDSIEQLKREERARTNRKKADRFWQAFALTENGKVKSTLLLNSFCLCLVMMGVYFGAFALLVGPLHTLVGGGPIWWVNLVEALVPALAGALVCGLAGVVFREKRLLPAAYLWLLVLAAACFVTMLILLRDDRQSQLLFLHFFALFIPAPLLLGGGWSLLLYRRYQKRRPPLPAETETWKRT